MNPTDTSPTLCLQHLLTMKQIHLATQAYRFGDRLGAPWEGQGPTWTTTEWGEVLHRYRPNAPGTDESDTVDCFERFISIYSWQDDHDAFLCNWARFHESNHRCTSYGKTWKDYFLTVNWLAKKKNISVEKLNSLSLDRYHGGSAGNGCLALVLPVYKYALELGFNRIQREEMVVAVVSLSHAGKDALATVRFLCWFFDELFKTDASYRVDPEQFKNSFDLYRFLIPADATSWKDVDPIEFSKHFSQNLLCGATLVHALYGIERSKSWKDLVTHIISMRGDVDSVLSLALMLWFLIHPEEELDTNLTTKKEG